MLLWYFLFFLITHFQIVVILIDILIRNNDMKIFQSMSWQRTFITIINCFWFSIHRVAQNHIIKIYVFFRTISWHQVQRQVKMFYFVKYSIVSQWLIMIFVLLLNMFQFTHESCLKILRIHSDISNIHQVLYNGKCVCQLHQYKSIKPIMLLIISYLKSKLIL